MKVEDIRSEFMDDFTIGVIWGFLGGLAIGLITTSTIWHSLILSVML